MRTTATLLTAALALGIAAPASAQVIRDHRGQARTPIGRPAPRTQAPPRTYHDPYYGRGGGSYYVNGLWVRDTPIRQPISDPLWFRYPGVAAPSGPVEVIYDASGTYMWIPGYWDLYQGRWIWVDGFWEVARSGYYYQPGYWHAHRGRWVRQTGHWARMPAANRGVTIRRADQRVTPRRNERVPARRGTYRLH